jgi:hypothetical protein
MAGFHGCAGGTNHISGNECRSDWTECARFSKKVWRWDAEEVNRIKTNLLANLKKTMDSMTPQGQAYSSMKVSYSYTCHYRNSQSDTSKVCEAVIGGILRYNCADDNYVRYSKDSNGTVESVPAECFGTNPQDSELPEGMWQIQEGSKQCTCGIQCFSQANGQQIGGQYESNLNEPDPKPETPFPKDDRTDVVVFKGSWGYRETRTACSSY